MGMGFVVGLPKKGVQFAPEKVLVLTLILVFTFTG